MTDQGNPNDDVLFEELGRLVQALSAASKTALAGSPDALLNSIVEAAARIFGAAAASILLVHEAEAVLEFKVTYGTSNHDLVGMRFPINQGIAGYVVMSGQPIAISDVSQDSRFNQDFAKSTGYVPRSILATPLLAGERVLGVMEVLDKINAPSFGMQDMELLGLFARQAALAIDQAQTFEDLSSVLVLSMRRLADADPNHPMEHILAAMRASPEAGSQRDLLKLVDLLNAFGRMGEAEREMALNILSAVEVYSKNQRRMTFGAPWR